jgi:hypothetical protein
MTTLHMDGGQCSQFPAGRQPAENALRRGHELARFPAIGIHFQGAPAAMASFDDRKKGFEDKYKHDKELEFKINARRNKLLGLWAAKEMGIPAAEAEAYAKSVVMADFEKPGDDDVVQKVVTDAKLKGIDMTEHRVRKHMAELLDTARQQIMSELK